MATTPPSTTGPLVCERCDRPVEASAVWYASVYERMHRVCFHYEFEHDDVDPDLACSDPACPSHLTELSSPHQPLTRMQHQWADDQQVLAEIGRALVDQDLLVTVVVPAGLAQAAVRAWDREDENEDENEDDDHRPLPLESSAQRRVRHRAAVLALIGTALEEGGRRDGDLVHVRLSADLVGAAVAAADEAGPFGETRFRSPG